MLDDLEDQCQCLFRIVASQVIDLGNDMLVQERQKLEQKHAAAVFIGLSEMGWVIYSVTQGLKILAPFDGFEPLG